MNYQAEAVLQLVMWEVKDLKAERDKLRAERDKLRAELDAAWDMLSPDFDTLMVNKAANGDASRGEDAPDA